MRLYSADALNAHTNKSTPLNFSLALYLIFMYVCRNIARGAFKWLRSYPLPDLDNANVGMQVEISVSSSVV